MIGHYWGMHLFWWIFWIALVVLLFSFATPGRRTRTRERPMEILQRRYAAGEISTEEYEERRSKLLKDGVASDA